MSTVAIAVTTEPIAEGEPIAKGASIIQVACNDVAYRA